MGSNVSSIYIPDLLSIVHIAISESVNLHENNFKMKNPITGMAHAGACQVASCG